MNKGKKWEIVYKELTVNRKPSSLTVDELIKILFENRGLKTAKEIGAFIHPNLPDVTLSSVGIDEKAVGKTLERLQMAKEKKEKVVIFGDYDVDGITGTCILWETLYALGFDVTPYIPHRVEEGYGLSQKGIENVLREKPDIKIIITVDNGIVASEAVAFAKEKGIDVIITDHHTVGQVLPEAYAIVHTTKLCGAGVAYLLSQKISNTLKPSTGSDKNSSLSEHSESKGFSEHHLALVALATVADLVPLQGANRTLLIEGLKLLQTTKRPGILALCEEAQINPEDINVYAIGHMIGPRLNAMGRMESAMDSLRLLCTKDRLKAKVYADKLGSTNKERQFLTQTLSDHAKSFVRNSNSIKNILFVANDSYEEGVIGLIAGKLVEEFYRPAIVIAKGEKISKASARSVTGFNIIEFIRSASHLLINAGGHPMAAGFTVETEKIHMLQEYLEDIAAKELHDDLLQRVLKIDCELPLYIVTFATYEAIKNLSPFGMGNSEPVFASEAVVKDIKTVGQEGRHLKLVVVPRPNATSGIQYAFLDAIGFGLGDMRSELKVEDIVNIAYVLDVNVWNGKKSLQLKIRDIKKI